MRRIVVLLLLAVALSPRNSVEATTRPAAPIYDPARDPDRGLGAALAEARRSEKQVLLEIGGDWCGWCRELERVIRADRRLQRDIGCTFVVVKVNVSPANPNRDFLARYPAIPGYPYFFVVGSDGSVLAAVDADDFVSGESYDRSKLSAFAGRWAPAGSK